MKFLLRIQYLGTNFCGWQYQPGVRTVQKTLTDAATALFGAPCRITGCSRTDSGVHALDFAASLEVPPKANAVPPDKIPAALAFYLPHDLSVKSASPVCADFHPRYDVVYKEYMYKIHTAAVEDPFLYGRVWHLPGAWLPDAAERMNACANVLVGRHDFASFMSAGSKITDTVRTVNHCTVECRDGLLELRIAADGFLYNMVRIIAGTLTQAGFGKLNERQMNTILHARDRTAAGVTAPPDGLYLNEVFYG